MSFTALLKDTATVTRHTANTGNIGNPVRKTSTRYSAVPARIEPLSEQERVMAGREGAVATHRIFLEGDKTAINHNDTITISGADYDVVAVLNIPDASGIHHIEVTALRRT